MQWCNSLTLNLEQSGGVGLIPASTPPFKCHDKDCSISGIQHLALKNATSPSPPFHHLEEKGCTTQIEKFALHGQFMCYLYTFNFSCSSSHKIFAQQQKKTIGLLFIETSQAIWMKERFPCILQTFQSDVPYG